MLFLIPDPDDRSSKTFAGMRSPPFLTFRSFQPIDPSNGFSEPERAVLNRFTKELRAACGRQINHFVSAGARDLEPRQGPERSMRSHQVKEKRPKEQNLQLFCF